ncbi:hypothetical protein Tco_1316254 [Tanacetum coccineum]
MPQMSKISENLDGVLKDELQQDFQLLFVSNINVKLFGAYDPRNESCLSILWQRVLDGERALHSPKGMRRYAKVPSHEHLVYDCHTSLFRYTCTQGSPMGLSEMGSSSLDFVSTKFGLTPFYGEVSRDGSIVGLRILQKCCLFSSVKSLANSCQALVVTFIKMRIQDGYRWQFLEFNLGEVHQRKIQRFLLHRDVPEGSDKLDLLMKLDHTSRARIRNLLLSIKRKSLSRRRSEIWRKQ